MTNHLTVSKIITPPVYMASLDLTDAYTHIPMRQNLHKYLTFSYENTLYFCRALPFGLSPAPYIFTKVLSWPLGLLHQQGVNAAAYLDDWLLWHHTENQLSVNLKLTIDQLLKLGFTINWEKSTLSPSTELERLGVVWQGLSGHWMMPKEKKKQINSTARSLLHSRMVTRRHLEAFLGMLNFACQVHQNLSPMFQPIAQVGLIAVSCNRDQEVQLPHTLKQALWPWTKKSIWKVTPQFASNLPKNFLWTDASSKGWGALYNSNQTTQGKWSKELAREHINLLELLAVSLAIKTLDIRNCNLLLYIDNEVARFTIAKGRSKSPILLQEVKSLINLCQEKKIFLSATRIPSKLNVVADTLSRTSPLSTEWCLPRHVFKKIQQWCGNLSIDMMATPLNTQLPKFISPFLHPKAEGTNVLAVD